MKIEEFGDFVESSDERVHKNSNNSVYGKQLQIVSGADAKMVLVGAGARILFYPTLLYNVCRNKIQPEFRWWDEVDQFVLLGAVPFPKDVPRLRQLGVGGVITLNEPYETLVPTSLYHAHGIEHLVIPTRDYLFAPSFTDINQAVDFIHKNASNGRTTYVHCKAGRGRSTTIVLCYLVEHKHMTPASALEYVRSRRPRVLLAPSQWKAVQEYSKCCLSPIALSPSIEPVPEYTKHRTYTSVCSPSHDAVLITKADLEGYHVTSSENNADKNLEIVPRPMIARLSCLFASLKVSGNCGQAATRHLTEARAC